MGVPGATGSGRLGTGSSPLRLAHLRLFTRSSGEEELEGRVSVVCEPASVVSILVSQSLV